MFVEHKEAIEITPAKVLKLSEAIRIGAKLRPPVRDRSDYFDDCGSCALGAAYQAMTGTVRSVDEHEEIYTYFEAIGITYETMQKVCDLFYAGRTREQIADWLEGQGY